MNRLQGQEAPRPRPRPPTRACGGADPQQCLVLIGLWRTVLSQGVGLGLAAGQAKSAAAIGSTFPSLDSFFPVFPSNSRVHKQDLNKILVFSNATATVDERQKETSCRVLVQLDRSFRGLPWPQLCSG